MAVVILPFFLQTKTIKEWLLPSFFLWFSWFLWVLYSVPLALLGGLFFLFADMLSKLKISIALILSKSVRADLNFMQSGGKIICFPVDDFGK
jgi:hypothetical protein